MRVKDPDLTRKLSQCLATAQQFGRQCQVYMTHGHDLDLLKSDARIACRYAAEVRRLEGRDV